jgi:hypothetical protein
MAAPLPGRTRMAPGLSGDRSAPADPQPVVPADPQLRLPPSLSPHAPMRPASADRIGVGREWGADRQAALACTAVPVTPEL